MMMQRSRDFVRRGAKMVSWRRCAGAVACVAVLGILAAGPASAGVGPPSAQQAGRSEHTVTHVLLISVDGMHQSDLAWFEANHPNSELARLVRGGREFSNAHTSDPSDSDPGGTALVTGGDPRATGVYYDVEYSHDVFPPGTTHCSGPVPGGNVIYDSPDDTLNAVPDLLNNGSGNTFPSFDEGGSIYPNGVDTNPGAIMNLTPHPQSGLNPATYPVRPTNCQPIMPWDYLKVNTIFQVIHNAGMRTAWSDKHAVYSSFNGPGSHGHSIDDLFAPEIDSQAVEPNGVPYPQDDDWAHIDAATKQYDAYKVQAIINELDGYDHSGRHKVGVPAILGMNFQAVSVAEKVDSPGSITKNADGTYTVGPTELAGYHPGTTTPRPLLAGALQYVDAHAVRRRATSADGRPDPPKRPCVLHGDHHHSQARSVAAESVAAEADRRRAHHQRRQRGLVRAAEPDRHARSDDLLHERAERRHDHTADRGRH